MARYRLTYDHHLKIKGQPLQLYVEKGTEVGDGTDFDFEGPPSMFMEPLDEAAKAAVAARSDRKHPVESLAARGDPTPPTMMPAIGTPALAPGQKLVSLDKKEKADA